MPVLLQVDTEDTPAASTMRKGRILQDQIRIRICLELGNLADEQPLQCPVPPSSSSVLWCRPSHTARRVALTRSDDCREAPPLPFITLPYTDGMTTPHWRTHPAIRGGHSSSSRRHHAGGDQRRFQYQAAHHAGDTTHLETYLFSMIPRAVLPSQPRAVKGRHATCCPAARYPSFA